MGTIRVLGGMAVLLLVSGAATPVWGLEQQSFCRVHVCGTEHGNEVVGCLNVPIVVEETLGVGSGAGLDPGECADEVATTSCDEIAECKELVLRKQTPALGAMGLGLTGMMLAAGGILGLRRRRGRS